MSRDPIGLAMATMSRIASSSFVERMGLRTTIEKLTYQGTKSGFKALGVASRQFKSASQLLRPERLEAPAQPKTQFDLTISDEQQMMRDSVRAFATEVLRPAAAKSNDDEAMSADILAQANELGLSYFAVPENLGGAATERSPVTSMLIAEDLAYGDMGLAVAILSSIGVANALTQWGTATQQSKYLPAFLEENTLQAAIAINEKRPLFNANELTTVALEKSDGYLLNGEKTMVPLIDQAELFLVAASLNGKPRLFIVESGSQGVTIAKKPNMGVKAAAMGDLSLEQVSVSKDALLGGDEFDYQAFINMARLGWCALAVGTAQAVLDYVIPYCNERVAFGEPISHRQAVAFMIANIGIEMNAMRLMTQRAVALAERGKPFAREAYLARVICADKAMEIGTNGVQLLGGHGFTKEHPVELWYRDLRAIAVMDGGLHL
ncbi:MAG: butyryl-CoA dehydrogenase [Pseudomonadales bacterium]|jgi:alkylation response protein AidB-like acyl-CoA dehydrogenase|nr:butyryl-CoA dehydrogenase [Pseudomonadales bacterium]MEC8810321.1 acyl-CoA dehydrogenase family protein [Pseudomonadota bacterium]HAG94518.1 butyryl-CoA dehydrogenase [Gammaproteobacteria bacterium]MBI26214.1 butyryl-CoA dehydrogenase [Pseudomonadales bacterium]HBO93774.1 butyryl-CoA dehydrogenase [Gammaproteobacteria bacterium]|tara:strand:+ start:58198 stop:59505 length:1308 start_codon:yes stop_codon:yes gene_type:complete